MKINKIFILSLLLISMLSIFVVGTSYEQFGIQSYLGSSNPDTYNLRSVSTNSIDSTDDIIACSVGYGSNNGVYPISSTSFDSSTKYNYLIVPTGSSMRMINSACAEISLVSLSGITFYGTMSTIGADVNTPEKYVMFGYNTTSDESGFFVFNFDEVTETLIFNSQKMLNVDVDLDAFHGGACGWKQKNNADDGMCAIVDGNTIYIWDIETDLILNQTIVNSVDRSVPLFQNDGIQAFTKTIPYGACLDFDNDGNNEFVFSMPSLNKFKYVSYDLYSESLDKDVSISLGLIMENYQIYSGCHNSEYNDHIVVSSPCQIGGSSSEFEMCVNLKYCSDTNRHPARMSSVIEQDGTTHIQENEYGPLFMMNTGVYSEFSPNKQYTTYTGTATTTKTINIKSDDYSTILTSFTIPISDYDEQIGTLMFDISGDDDLEFIMSSGEIFNTLSGNRLDYKLPYLTNTTGGYLTAGDLNGDLVNEIVYSDANNIYIYSTNPTSDYITDLSINIPYAYDLDGGIVYTDSDYTYNGSTVYGVNTNQTVAYDTCSSINLDVVQEYYLDGNEVKVLNYDCTAGGYYSCLAGMCLSETLYNFTDEGIQNGTIDFISGGWIENGSSVTPSTSEDVEINFVLDSLNDNLKLIFALFMIAGIVILTAKQTKSPMVLVFVGIITTVMMSYLGMIPSVVLIIL